jgi:hypothetical protein
VAAYETFIRQSSDAQLKAEAQTKLATLQANARKAAEEEQAAFIAATNGRSASALAAFLRRYPNTTRRVEAENLIEQLDLESALAEGSVRMLKDFLVRHPKTKHAQQVRGKLAEISFSEAERAGTDDALITFIQEFHTSTFLKPAVQKLKHYDGINPGQTIPWAALPGVAGTLKAAGYDISMNMSAFDIEPDVVDYQGHAMVGAMRFFKANTKATINFRKWTRFDDHLALGVAAITPNGLVFDETSTVLRQK